MDLPEMLPLGGVSPPTPTGDADADHDPCYYPTGDGEPMAETPLHGDAMLSIFFQLGALAVLRGRQADWYRLRDNFWYFERGDPSKCCAPDVAHIEGATNPADPRDCWKEWLEGGLRPSVVFEMASRSTVTDNLTAKRDLYESLGVEEYFLFDPTGVFLDPRLRGFRLSRGKYRELAPDSQGPPGQPRAGGPAAGRGPRVPFVRPGHGRPNPDRIRGERREGGPRSREGRSGSRRSPRGERTRRAGGWRQSG